MDINEHVKKLKDWMEFKKYSPRSVKNYCSNFGLFLKHFEQKGVTHPDRINSDQIIAFLSGINQPSTHSGYHSAIKIYYQKVAHVGIQKFKYIERPRKSSKLPIVLSMPEMQLMFNACNNLKHKVILSLLYSCGLRAQELLNLKWENINRSEMVINVISGKGNKDRCVPLASSVIPLLEKYYYQYHPKTYVINGQYSKGICKMQYTQSSVRKIIKKLAIKANISKKVYTHLIRHCCFTHMLEGGVGLSAIQNMAGHTDPKTTTRYFHMSTNYISNIPSPINSMQLGI